MLLLERKKAELLFISGALISSAVMDSPLWGIIRLDVHNLALWHAEFNGKELVRNFVSTNYLNEWISYYYNPIGLYPVWNGTQSNAKNINGLTFDSPNAATIFWSLVGRIILACFLIYYEIEPIKRLLIRIKSRN